MTRSKNKRSTDYPKEQITVGTLMIIAAVALMTFNGVRILPFLTISDAFLSVGAFFLIMRMLVKPSHSKMIQVPPWLFYSLSLIIISSFITIIASGEPLVNIERSVNIIIAAGGVTIFLGIVASNENQLNLILAVWTIFVAINAGIGLMDLLFDSGIGFWFTDEYWFGRTAGLTMHPNHLGIACAMVMPIALVQTKLSKTTGSLFIRILVLLTLSLGILSSGSRAAIAGSCFSLILLIFFNKTLINSLLLVFIIGLLSALILAAFNKETLNLLGFGVQRLFGFVSVAESNLLRLEYYKEAYFDFSKNPLFGVGYGVVRQAHNIYLQILQAGGLLGFVGFYWFIIGFLSLGWNIRSNARFRIKNPLIVDALIVSILTWLVIGLFFNLIFDRFLYIPMGLLLGIKGILSKDQYCFS